MLFGFGVGFYIFLKVPLLGVLIYGIAEASTAYLITKITDPPPPPAYAEKFAESQVTWKNKQEFLRLPLANLDANNTDTGEEQQGSCRYGWYGRKEALLSYVPSVHDDFELRVVIDPFPKLPFKKNA